MFNLHQVFQPSTSLLLVLGVSLFQCGCGGSVRGELNEAELIGAQILGLADVAGDAVAFKEAFVSGAAPADHAAYAAVAFELVGEPSISGDTASATVKVIPGLASSEHGDRPVSTKKNAASSTPQEVEWTLQRVDGGWKIQDAPLP